MFSLIYDLHDLCYLPLGVGLGAIGAHAITKRSDEMKDVWKVWGPCNSFRDVEIQILHHLTFCLFRDVDRINVSYDTRLCSWSRRRFDNVAEKEDVGRDTFYIGYHSFFRISIYCSNDESKEAILIYCPIRWSLSHRRLACLRDLLNVRKKCW